MKEYGVLKKSSYATPERLSRGGGWNPDKKEERPLSGQINNLKAAAGEERLSRGLYKRMKAGTVLNFYFRSSPGLPKGLPGWKELDFEIFSIFGHFAVSVQDMTYIHHTEAQRSQDKLNSLIIMERLYRLERPVRRVDLIDSAKLKDQEGAEKELLRLGIR